MFRLNLEIYKRLSVNLYIQQWHGRMCNSLMQFFKAFNEHDSSVLIFHFVNQFISEKLIHVDYDLNDWVNLFKTSQKKLIT